MADAHPALIGVLLDIETGDDTLAGPASKLAIADVGATGRLDREIVFVQETAPGLPHGTAHAVEAAFHRLVERGVLAIVGPAVTDNGLVVRDLADAARIPCINWTGCDLTRSEWMFHYQVGSLEEEPHLLADRLYAAGHRRVVMVQDRSPIGQRYGRFFEAAAQRLGLEIGAKELLSPVTADARAAVGRVHAQGADALVYLGLGFSAFAVGTAVADVGWAPTVVANSALMFGYAHPEWTEVWDGWTYVDCWSEHNPVLASAQQRLGDDGLMALNVVTRYDLARLVAEAVAGAELLSPGGIKASLEELKCLPSALGTPGTTMGFGHWDRAALKGGYLVPRQWRDGRSQLA
ncbi:MAG TPA: ABC transporter substrate-binding protein [Acidimicrobiales bacterium]|nr:ABC transporter substrate-binding protein [Acidimicrobiales bacterium]